MALARQGEWFVAVGVVSWGCWSSRVSLAGRSLTCPLLLPVFQTRAADGGPKGVDVRQPSSQR